jgi:aryl carrier-like protein
LTVDFVADANEIVLDMLFQLLLQNARLQHVAINAVNENFVTSGMDSLRTLLWVKRNRVL